MSSTQLSELRSLLELFMSGEDQSLELAGRIEVALDDAFPEDPRIQDVVHALAFYRPGGGDYLYAASEIVPLIRDALSHWGSLQAAPTVHELLP
jgi:hypothetical protein